MIQRVRGVLTTLGRAIPLDVTVLPTSTGEPGAVEVSIKLPGETSYANVAAVLETNGWVRVPDRVVFVAK